MRIWDGLKLTSIISLIVGLVFSSALFSVLLYAEITGKELTMLSRKPHGDIVYADSAEQATNETFTPEIDEPDRKEAKDNKEEKGDKTSAMISAPLLRQNPELPAGCEITSLTMLIQYYGIKKNKMDLVPEMKVDLTPIVWGEDGKIKYWGNPNAGFVGDITRNKMGFGIYHAALFELLKKYIPTGVDLTGGSFNDLEHQLAEGLPIVVWTTIHFKTPQKWVEWNTAAGPVRTTFSEHAVLLVGYDKNNVYVNDPLSGKKSFKVNKKQFIASWEAMGKQSLSYTK